MDYLGKKKWRSIELRDGNKKVSRKNSNLHWIKTFGIFAGLWTIFGIVALWLQPPSTSNEHRTITGFKYSQLEKDLEITHIQISYEKHFSNGIFASLGDVISFMEEGEGEKIDTDFDSIRYAAYNAERMYFAYTATDWILPSILFNNKGKAKTELVAMENFSKSFSVVPYGNFADSKQKSAFNIDEPFFKNEGMQGLENGFYLNFPDKKRLFKPNDTLLVLRPNLYRTLHAAGKEVELSAPSLEPEETLVAAAYLTDLCDHKTGKWDVAKTQWWVSQNYAIAYRYPLNPEKISVIGEGINARFVYSEKLPSAIAKLRNKRGELSEIELQLQNSRGELCFWASNDPTQSIFIPFSYLHRLQNDETMLLGSASEIEITFQDVLDAAQQVRDNKQFSRKEFLYPGKGGDFGEVYLASHVVDTPRLRKIAEQISRGAKTPEEIAEKFTEYSAKNIGYISDFVRGKTLGIGNVDTPEEIARNPFDTLINGALGDCEDHAIFAASLFLSARNPILNNSQVGLGVVAYIRNKVAVGHAVTMLPEIGEFITDPFPNHVLIGGTPFTYFEATGAGYNSLHQLKPQSLGELPQRVIIIGGNGRDRTLSVAGFTQFEYLQEEEDEG